MKFLAFLLAAAGIASAAPVITVNDPSQPHALIHVLLPDGRVLADRMYYNNNYIESTSQLANKFLEAKSVKIVSWVNGARPLDIECGAIWYDMAHPVYLYMGGKDEEPTQKWMNLDLGAGNQKFFLQGYYCHRV